MKKHQKLVDRLANQLKEKPYVDWVRTNVEYGDCGVSGECDVLTKQGGRLVYYEVKSNDHPRAYEKAQKQIKRWANHHDQKYGVYWTPQKMELIRK